MIQGDLIIRSSEHPLNTRLLPAIRTRGSPLNEDIVNIGS